MTAVRATVVVVTYNHRAHIQACLDALGPTLGPADEVVVVDNASGDGTADQVSQAYPWVHLVQTGQNRGFGAACNLAARSSRGEYLVFLNPDTQSRQGWLDALLRALSETPVAGLATAKLLLAASPERIDTFGHDVHVSGIATCRAWGLPAESRTQVEEVAAVSGACFAIRRELFAELGGFDECLFLYYEDDELSLRARLAGWRCIAVPAAEVLHDHRPGFTPEKLRYLERNRWWTLLKLYRWRTLLALAPVLLAGEAPACGLAVLNGPRHAVAMLQAWADLLSWLPGLPAARATVRRRIADTELLALHGSRLSAAQVHSGKLADAAESALEVAFRCGRALAVRLADG